MEYNRLKDTEIKKGSRIYVSYLIHRVDVCDQKHGGKYLNMTIGDQSKVCNSVKLFGASENAINSIVAGKVYRGAIDVKEYNGANSLVIYNIEEFEGADVREYLSYEEGYVSDGEELKTIIASLPQNLNALVQTCIDMTEGRFWYWTAAKRMHHSKLSGLLVHTTEVVKIAASIYDNCKVPKYCDRNILIASCILHDIGKCVEYNVDQQGTTEITTQGILEGHISIGVRILEKASEFIKRRGIEVPNSDIEAIRHCILSHHGKLEFGSPVTPSTIEAIILHFADEISAQLNSTREQMKEMEVGDYVSSWVGDGYKNIYLRPDLVEK